MLKRQRGQSGFTLVELLVAMLLGIVLSGGIINLYLNVRESSFQDEELARMQENSRYAIGLLKSELMLAGFMGGLADPTKLDPIPTVTDGCVTANNWMLDITSPIDSINDIGANVTSTRDVNLDGCLTLADIVSGTDVITLKRTAGNYTLNNGSLVGTAGDTQRYIRSQANEDYSWVLTDAIDAADATAGSEIDYWKYYAKVYFIRKNSIAGGSDGIPTLCLKQLIGDSKSTASCLVEGVEDMQFEVGVDTDDDGVANRYSTMSSTDNIDDAVSFKVYLLMRSIEEVPSYTNNKSYNLGQTPVAAKNDGYLRQVHSTVVSIRNATLD